MTSIVCRALIILGTAAAVWLWNGDIRPTVNNALVTIAQAVVGRPASPVSYAGVARRSTVGAGAPGVGVTPGVGAGAPGPGAAPGNRGGPVNRVGVR
jgi:hypothetical protein